ncbi:DinB family protein [Tenacibaculum sp. TC6]|uniref:DinB family protein n=1 Tax=Tenacibaculum sp. TC6 TaxID=3423223 RepID=UPI003D35ADA4
MQKAELIKKFIQNHQEIIQYIDNLDEKKFTYVHNGKWSAGQQLEHILLTIIPFPNILFSKKYLIEKFGYINRETWNYQTVLENYSKTTLKAPDRFLPQEKITINQKSTIISDIKKILEQIKECFEKYSEEELDTLTLPHPLLGKITIREMFYLMLFHPLHHKKQIQEILKNNID